MKRTIISLLIATTLLSITTQAQETKKKHSKTTFGIQGGANMNNVVGTDFPNGDKLSNDFIIGFHFGVNIEIPISGSIYFQPGLQAITKGAKKKTSNYTETENFYYVEMPLNFLFKPQAGSGHFLIGVGANVAYGIGGKWKYDEVGRNQFDENGKIKFKNSWNPLTPNPEKDKYIRPLDVSAGLILGYQLKNNLFFQLNGQYSVLNVIPKIETTTPGFVQGNGKNINFGLSVGYRFK
jgi:Outer membrane protein beta-barrel domain